MPAARIRTFVGTCNNWCDDDIAAILSVYKQCSRDGCLLVSSEHWKASDLAEGKTPHLHMFYNGGTKSTAMTATAFAKRIRKAYRDSKWCVFETKDRAPYKNAMGYVCKGSGDDERFALAQKQSTSQPVLPPGWGIFEPFGSTIASDCVLKTKEGVAPMKVGTRTDIEELRDMCMDVTTPLADALQSNLHAAETFMRMPQGATKLRSLCQLGHPRKLSEPPKVYVLYGATGTGKSFEINRILTMLDDPYYVLNTGCTANNTVWMDGYDGQTIAWFSEFRSGIPFAKMLELLDRYECKVQIKGAMTQFMADTIFICSPVAPDSWYPNLDNQDGAKDQLNRRITRAIRMDGVSGQGRGTECINNLCCMYDDLGLVYPLYAQPSFNDALDATEFDADVLEIPDEDLEAIVDACVDEDDPMSLEPL